MAATTQAFAKPTLRLHDIEAVISSELMQKLVAMVERVARGNAAVLITGETGTGKELIARAVHHFSLRAKNPWVDLNCAALPEHLVESELFGYEKGAFSGADASKPGMFELADGGTLFLDEIGELEPKVQVKLLRVLDGAPYYRLGGSRKVSVDVRLVTATNKSLDEAVRSGRFREDLLHRLGEIQLRVPPLRERLEDIAPLAKFFLERRHPGFRIEPDTLEALRCYHWPGNIRQLRNIIAQAATVAQGDVLRPEDLPPAIRQVIGPGAQEPAKSGQEPKKPVITSDLDELERQTIVDTLESVGGHQGLAAERLGISRRTLSRKLSRYRQQSESSFSPALGRLSQFEEQYYRARVSVDAEIMVRGTKFPCTVVNISAGGMSLDGIDEPLALADGFTVGFLLPGTEQLVESQARLVWVESPARIGVKFVSLPASLQGQLARWLAEKQAEEGWQVNGRDPGV